MHRGTKPKPTKLKIMTNTRKDRINGREPVAGGLPKCPDHLDAEAKREWKRAVKKLSAMGVIAAIDGTALAMYCQVYSRWVWAENELKKETPLIHGTTGAYQNPALAIANKAFEQTSKMLAEFGMTPSSRSRVHVQAQSAEVDEFEAGLNVAN